MTNIITGIILSTKYNTGIILGTFGSWVACNAPFILYPDTLSFLNLIILISILVTSVLQSWYSASLLVVSTNNMHPKLSVVGYPKHQQKIQKPNFGLWTI